MNPVEKYIVERSSPESDLLRELDRQTNLRVVQPRMISGHIQGKLLEMIVRMIRPRNILEIGTFTGYSAISMAAGLEDGAEIDTIEIDDELEPVAREFFDRCPWGDKIRLHIGSALDIVPKLGKLYDLIFIDGDKREYPQYYSMAMNITRSGSFILADNILWYGKVTEQLSGNDLYTKGIIEFNDLVHSDDRVENVILAIRDGINIIRVK